MLIFSLGNACRPAWQLKKNFESNFTKGPFDWTVSSAKSIHKFFTPEYKLESCLSPASIHFIENGTIVKCDYSDLIFHHELGPKRLEEMLLKNKIDSFKYSPTPSSYFLNHFYYRQTKERFMSTAQRLLGACQFHDSKIIFVRWVGCGVDNPDSKIPHTGQAESDDNAISMAVTIKNRFPSINMHFIQVQSIYAKKHEDKNRIAFVDKVQDDVTLIYLKENITMGFGGDDESWSQLSQYILNT